MKRVLNWIMQAILLPLDYFASGVLWQYPGMTISSRCGEELNRPQPGVKHTLLRALGRVLNWLQAGHCQGAIINDLARLARTQKRLEEAK